MHRPFNPFAGSTLSPDAPYPVLEETLVRGRLLQLAYDEDALAPFRIKVDGETVDAEQDEVAGRYRFGVVEDALLHPHNEPTA